MNYRTSFFALLATFIFLAAAAAPSVDYPDEAPGQLTFIGNAGGDNVFTVEEWKFDRLTSLDDPTNIGVTATLNMASITCEWQDLEKALHKKKDYFNSRKFTSAKITIDGAEPMETPDTYRARATLELKGVTKEVPIHFTLTGSGPYQLVADAIVVRQQFRFNGDGPNDEVPVHLEAVLEGMVP